MPVFCREDGDATHRTDGLEDGYCSFCFCVRNDDIRTIVDGIESIGDTTGDIKPTESDAGTGQGADEVAAARRDEEAGCAAAIAACASAAGSFAKATGQFSAR